MFEIFRMRFNDSYLVIHGKEDVFLKQCSDLLYPVICYSVHYGSIVVDFGVKNNEGIEVVVNIQRYGIYSELHGKY